MTKNINLDTIVPKEWQVDWINIPPGSTIREFIVYSPDGILLLLGTSPKSRQIADALGWTPKKSAEFACRCAVESHEGCPIDILDPALDAVHAARMAEHHETNMAVRAEEMAAYAAGMAARAAWNIEGEQERKAWKAQLIIEMIERSPS